MVSVCVYALLLFLLMAVHCYCIRELQMCLFRFFASQLHVSLRWCAACVPHVAADQVLRAHWRAAADRPHAGLHVRLRQVRAGQGPHRRPRGQLTYRVVSALCQCLLSSVLVLAPNYSDYQLHSVLIRKLPLPQNLAPRLVSHKSIRTPTFSSCSSPTVSPSSFLNVYLSRVTRV